MKNEMGRSALARSEPPPLTSGEIEELERLLEKATAGPWTVELYGDVGSDSLVIHSDAVNRVCFMATPGHDYERHAIAANATLIAAMRNALPRLLSSLKLSGGSAAQGNTSAAGADVIEEAARIAENGCLVPPDGGSPTESERLMCGDIAKRIRALAPHKEPWVQRPGPWQTDVEG